MDWVKLAEVLLIVVVAGVLIVFIWMLHGWTRRVNDDRTVFKHFMEKIDKKIEEIFERLPKLALGSGSPIKLTDFGELLASEINAKEWAPRLWDSAEMKSRVSGKSNYEIQTLCLEYTTNELQYGKDELELMGKCAFDNGVELEVVKRVLGVVLRDQIIPPAPPAS